MGHKLYQEGNVDKLLKKVQDVGSTQDLSVQSVSLVWVVRVRLENLVVITSSIPSVSNVGRRVAEVQNQRAQCAELRLMYRHTSVDL